MPLLFIILLALLIATPSYAQPVSALKGLKENQVVEGFRARALYLNDAGDAMGARFVHEKTGFTLDLLRLQSVPQSFLWVNSWPTSDMGEPHTQEHLLLGKGNKGRAVSGMEDALLVGSSAFTMQWRTAYHFQTEAGADAYFTILERQLDALLHPDYTDEEIRREVANFGVVDNPDGTLGLEEKGSVYNEMVSSFERPWSRMARVLGQLMYGPDHPLTYVSGGEPSAIRRMQPDDIRRFHAANYHLANMGMIASFPRQIGVEEALRRIGAALERVEPDGGRTRRFTTLNDVPAPKMAPEGTIAIAEYPNSNASQPGIVLMGWPPDMQLSSDERLLLNLFLQSFAGDASTNLYKRLVDSRTRSIDVGATSVFAWVDNDPGYPVYIGLDDVDPSHMTTEGLARIRGEVQKELRHVMSLLDDSPELREINNRVRTRVAETRRSLEKFINSPPGFGSRGTRASWMEHLRDLEELPGFAKSVTQRDQLDRVLQLLKGNDNIWRDKITQWGLITRDPYVSAAKPSPALVEKEAKERQARIDAEIARLRTLYNASSDQEAVRRYRDAYDATTAELDALAAAAKMTRFVETPPLTLDDELDFTVTTLASGAPLVTANFDDMTSATTGLALRLDGVPHSDLLYLSLLPDLLTGTGVMVKGAGMPFEQMSEQLRREVLGVTADFSTNSTTGRVELMMTAAGNDAKEADRAIEWMGMMLTAPFWAEKNIGRVRDVVEQRLSGLRSTMQGREEAWVHNPSTAYRRQDHPLLLATTSFLTRTHNALRLKWMLKDPAPVKSDPAFAAVMDDLVRAGLAVPPSRENLRTLLGGLIGRDSAVNASATSGGLGKDAKKLVSEIASDLMLALNEIPDNSLGRDWTYLVGDIRSNLMMDPLEAMRGLDEVRKSILKKRAVRAYMVGSRATQAKLKTKLEQLLATFSDAPFVAATYPSTPLVATRLRERTGVADPVFVGLVNPSTSSGVFLNSAPGTSYTDTARSALVDYLSAMMYGGGAGHGVFMRTWAAGLAYSNGISASARSGRINYYAERVPALPQTLRFVIDELRKAQPDTALVDYAISQAFRESRAAESFESRGAAMASDIADGLTPDVVRRFRRAILALRGRPELARELVERMPAVLGTVLPGYGPKIAGIDGAVHFVIGPDDQLQKYEEYLKTVEGPDARVHRLYPRDFWQVTR